MCCVLQGKQVSRTSLLQNLVRNTNINLAGIGITLVGLQASVGTLVSKTMLSAANAPYAAPAPGGTLVSLDVFSLQVRDSNAYIGDVTCCSESWLLGALHNVLCPPLRFWCCRCCKQTPGKLYLLPPQLGDAYLQATYISLLRLPCCVAACYLCVLQASTNTLLAHFLSVVFANCIIGVLSKVRKGPAAA